MRMTRFQEQVQDGATHGERFRTSDGRHQGVKVWYAAQPAAAPAGKKSAPAAPAAAKTPTVAAGDRPGLVWGNTSTKVYRCPGTKYYGTTKEGKSMSEADAKAMGARADHNQPWTK